MRRIPILLGLFLPLIWAFQSCQKAGKEEVFSLSTALADSLRAFDSVRVVLADENGNTLDVLYHGVVLQASDLKNLPAPHFKGENVIITVIGYDSNEAVFEVRKTYNPITGRTDSTTLILLPNSQVSIIVDSLVLTEGDTLDLPTATVTPANLANRAVVWSSSNPQSLALAANRMRALQPGSVYLFAALISDTTKRDSIPIRIRSLTPPVVTIVNPHDSFYTNQSVITVSWTVNGVNQSTQTQETLLRSGANLVIRSAQDALNRTYADSITVFLDTVAPAAPVFDSTPYSPLNTLRPRWTWRSGGNGGMGTYRCAVDDSLFRTGTDTVTIGACAPKSDLSEGPHTMYAQERDSAGNWSGVAKRRIVSALRGVVGQAGLSVGNGGFGQIAISKDDVPFVLFVDEGLGYRATVMSYNGNGWSNIGPPGFTDSSVIAPSLAIDSRGIPYVAYSAPTWSGRVVVKGFVNGAWTNIGNFLTATGNVSSPSIAISQLDIPYVVVIEGDSLGAKVRVKTFDGIARWIDVGDSVISPANADRASLALDSSGGPYISFVSDNFYVGEISVYKFQSNRWAMMGNSGFALSIDDYFPLAVSKSGIPTVGFSDYGGGLTGQPSFMSFSGTTWNFLGNRGLTSTPSDQINLTIGPDGDPYIAFNEKGAIHLTTVMKYDRSRWVTIGSPRFAPGTGTTKSLGVNSLGVPHLITTDSITGRALVFKTSFDP